MVRALTIFGVVAALTAAASAQPAVNGGTHELQANTAGQQISLEVTGGQAVQGVEFYAQLPAGDGPCFLAGDLLTGTIFEVNHDQDPNAWGSYVHAHDLYLGVATNSGTVSAAGKLVTLTLDTTGLWSGTYALQLRNDVEAAQTNFCGVDATLTDGTLTVVPEPGTLLLLAGGAAGLLRRRRR